MSRWIGNIRISDRCNPKSHYEKWLSPNIHSPYQVKPILIKSIDSDKTVKKPEILPTFQDALSNQFVEFAAASGELTGTVMKKSTIPTLLYKLCIQMVFLIRLLDLHFHLGYYLVKYGTICIEFLLYYVTVLVTASISFINHYENVYAKARAFEESLQESSTLKGSASSNGTPSASTASTNTNTKQEQDVITLNVGGTLFYTNKCTLKSVPNCYFTALSNSKKNSHFIDRDPTHFRHILNHMRKVDTIFIQKDPTTLKELQKEAAFYELLVVEEMLNCINNKRGFLDDIDDDEEEDEHVNDHLKNDYEEPVPCAGWNEKDWENYDSGDYDKLPSTLTLWWRKFWNKPEDKL